LKRDKTTKHRITKRGHLDRLSENTKSENIGVDIKGLITRKSAKIPILGQPVD